MELSVNSGVVYKGDLSYFVGTSSTITSKAPAAPMLDVDNGYLVITLMQKSDKLLSYFQQQFYSYYPLSYSALRFTILIVTPCFK